MLKEEGSVCVVQYERKYEGLLKEVRHLEGTLADHNLAMDKLRTSTDPDEVRGYHRQVRGTQLKKTHTHRHRRGGTRAGALWCSHCEAPLATAFRRAVRAMLGR